MALITCKECGKQFSDMAAACPNCGYSPVVERKKAVENSLISKESRKSKITAGFLCLFLWGLGAHEFYLGDIGKAIAWIIISLIVSIAAMFLPILVLLLLIPIICAVKLWAMPQEEFDLRYNQVSSPKGKMGCLFGVIIGCLIFTMLLVAFARPISQKILEMQHDRILNGSYSSQY